MMEPLTRAHIPTLQSMESSTVCTPSCSLLVSRWHCTLCAACVLHTSSRWCTATAPAASEASASAAEPASIAEAAPSADQVEELAEHGTIGATATELTSAPHPTDVLALGLDRELASTEKRLVQVLRLDRALLVRELNESLSVTVIKFKSRVRCISQKRVERRNGCQVVC